MLNAFRVAKKDAVEFAAPVEELWALLVQPEVLARHMPHVEAVSDLGDGRWRCRVVGIRYPGGSFEASFTQRMEFDPPFRVRFRHEPGAAREFASAEGSYELVPLPGERRTSLQLEAMAVVWLPVPRAASAVVTRTMGVVMTNMLKSLTDGLRDELNEDGSGAQRT